MLQGSELSGTTPHGFCRCNFRELWIGFPNVRQFRPVDRVAARFARTQHEVSNAVLVLRKSPVFPVNGKPDGGIFWSDVRAAQIAGIRNVIGIRVDYPKTSPGRCRLTIHPRPQFIGVA